MKEVSGKVAFVTGGASGIGLAMVRSFTGAGMKVIVADVQEDALAAVRSELEETNASVHTVQVDVTDRDAMVEAADEAESVFGNVHIVCNNAGVALIGPLAEADYRDWDWLINVNLQGVVSGLQTFVPRLLAHGEGGQIVNTASLAGVTSIPGFGVYNATKWAVVGISETLRKELASTGIGVSVLCPGVVSTNIASSDRNRPEPLQTGKPAIQLPEADTTVASVPAGVLDPAHVGDMVLAGIQGNDPYIFTHPELEPMSDARFAEMRDSFARWRRYREEQGI